VPEKSESARGHRFVLLQSFGHGFSDHQQFDFCEIAGLDVVNDSEKKGGNLMRRIEQQADSKRRAVSRRDPIIISGRVDHSTKRTRNQVEKAVIYIRVMLDRPGGSSQSRAGNSKVTCSGCGSGSPDTQNVL
jgi:hypothetical protein